MATAGARRPRFFGPASDLLFGCGLLYVGLFALQTVAGPTMRRLAPPDLAPFITILLGMPHYGATLDPIHDLRRSRGRAPAARGLGPRRRADAARGLRAGALAAARVWKGIAVVEPFGESGVAYAFLWVQVGHFVQYLWITSYYSAASATRARRARFLVGSLLAGAAVWSLPPLLFAPGALGRLPFDMGLALLAAAVVNIHHFVLDGAIWKLRDGRIARALLREPADPAAEPAEAARHGRIAPTLVGAAGALSLAVAALAAREGIAGNRAFGRADVERAKLALARLSWLGQDSPRIRAALGEYALRFDTRAAARQQIDRSLTLWPTANGWIALGLWYEAGGASQAAREAYERALALAPGDRIARASLERLRFTTGGYGPDDRRPAPPRP